MLAIAVGQNETLRVKLKSMRWLRVITLWLLALWLPATNHCLLESATGLEFLQSCCPEPAPHSNASCKTDSCFEVESGAYRLEEQISLLLPPCPKATIPGESPPSLYQAPQHHFLIRQLWPPPEWAPPRHLAWPVTAQPRAPSVIS